MNLKKSAGRIALVLLLALAALLPAMPDAVPVARAETASTVVGGPITTNTTWTKAGSPYLATTSVVVRENVTLTIEPGVTVKFDNNRGLVINGGLVARGTAAEPILFTSNSNIPAPGGWTAVFFEAPARDATYDSNGNYISGSVLQYAVVEYGGGDANKPAAVYIDQSAPWIDHVTVRYSLSSGLSFVSDNVRVTNSEFHENGGNGITYRQNSGGLLSANRVWGNTYNGIYAGGASDDQRMTISDNRVFENDGLGIQTDDYADIANNLVYRNGGGGIQAQYYVSIVGNIVAYNRATGIWINAISSVSRNKIAHNRSESGVSGVGVSYGIAITYNSIVFNHSAGGDAAVGQYADEVFGGPLRFNTIVGNTGDSASANNVGGTHVYLGANAGYPVTNNNIYGNQGYQLFADGSFDYGPLDARSNYWGTVDTLAIDGAIRDYYDDTQYAEANYDLFLAAPETAAPPAPPAGLEVDVDFDAFVLTWEPNQEADIAGYKVYYDTDGDYPWDGKGAVQGDVDIDAGIDAGNVTSFRLTGLQPNRNTYFMVTAYDNTGEESWYSLERVGRTEPVRSSGVYPERRRLQHPK